MRKIILLGYMGCGKSTIAKKLSNVTTIPFVDLDKCIEESEKKSIKEIFEQQGEIYFRKIEHEIFVELLESPDELIIGLGGGTPCYANNHELLIGDKVVSIYLKATVDTLVERLVANNSKRPLVANKTEEELRDFIGQHLFERSFYYNHAQNKLTVDHKTIDQTVKDILEILA